MVVSETASREAWLDKNGLAEHYSCSVRSVETARAGGMPSAVIFGRVKFQLSKVDPWLREHGYLQESGATGTVARSESGAGTADTAPRLTTGGKSDGS
jgi:hypothetical protein